MESYLSVNEYELMLKHYEEAFCNYSLCSEEYQEEFLLECESIYSTIMSLDFPYDEALHELVATYLPEDFDQ
jgi:hypothetical protein